MSDGLEGGGRAVSWDVIKKLYGGGISGGKNLGKNSRERKGNENWGPWQKKTGGEKQDMIGRRLAQMVGEIKIKIFNVNLLSEEKPGEKGSGTIKEGRGISQKDTTPSQQPRKSSMWERKPTK